ncbi:DUF6880 family protein [Nonomuraea basaltis]|uniref:DUF6880 family protein n=1 Tax=Nonomuraea basaltis TaxID=2495887 RepID=UPI00110C6C38|nr:DUF6880 family protein [Nonomuraea basaltis]TMR99621.1 hypothetical protein EJK15_06085 [Nonomuraea basaltis]
MALIQIDEETVRSQVSEPVFAEALALADDGKVAGLTESGASVSALVSGHSVTVTFTASGMFAACECLDPELCAHAAAAAVSWVRMGDVQPVPDLYALLRTQDSGWLARRLATLAAADSALADRLRTELAETIVAEETTDLLADLEEVMADMLAEAEDEDNSWDEDGWYPDLEDLEEILDEIDDLIEQTPDTARELIVRAVDLIEEALDTGEIYGGQLVDDLERVQGMHQEACLSGSPDPVKLAEWLMGKVLTSNWCTFESSLPTYAPALGDLGLRRCHELLDGTIAGRVPDYKLSTLRESLARAEGGTDAVVAMLARRAANSRDIAKIARLLIDEKRHDEALGWIDQGMGRYGRDQHLLTLALDCHQYAGRTEHALETRWQLFTLSPSMHTYQSLTRLADADAAPWKAKAITHLRSSAAMAHTLAEVLLINGDVAGAWEVLQTYGLGSDLRMRVVNARARTHPQDAIPVYQELAESSVSRASRPGYQEAIQYLFTLRTLFERAGSQAEFPSYVARLRAAHPGKKAFHTQLDGAGLL